jgi:hypothetical protein
MLQVAGDNNLSQYILALQKLNLRIEFFFGDIVAHHDWNILFRTHDWILALAIHQEFDRRTILRGLENRDQYRAQHNAKKTNHCSPLVPEADSQKVTHGKARVKPIVCEDKVTVVHK